MREEKRMHAEVRVRVRVEVGGRMRVLLVWSGSREGSVQIYVGMIIYL